MVFLGALLGIAAGIGLTIMLMTTIVKNSNDWGDSQAVLEDFSNDFTVIDQKNNVRKDYTCE